MTDGLSVEPQTRPRPGWRVADFWSVPTHLCRLRLLHRILARLSLNLFIYLLPQELRNHLGKGWIVHVASEYLLVLIHAVDELAFQGLVEDVLEILQRIDHRCLLNMRVGNRFFPDLVEKKLIHRFEVGSEPLIHDVDEPGEFDLLMVIFPRPDAVGAFTAPRSPGASEIEPSLVFWDGSTSG
jgi:hypothetical protein